MKPFTLARADTLDAALDELQAPGTMAIAGGTELLNWLKEGIVGPDRLLDISRLPMTGIETSPDRLVIGALARMSDVAAHRAVATGYPVLAQSLLLAASAQLRNMATIGGNLMQRTRCAYFRADDAAALQPTSARIGLRCPRGRLQRARHLRRHPGLRGHPPIRPRGRAGRTGRHGAAAFGVRGTHGRAGRLPPAAH